MAQTSIQSTAQMKATIQALQELVGRYKTDVEKVKSIGTEIDAMWDGDASDKFKAILDTDTAKFTAMEQLINSYIAYLTEAVTIYERAEDTATDILNTKKA